MMIMINPTANITKENKNKNKEETNYGSVSDKEESEGSIREEPEVSDQEENDKFSYEQAEQQDNTNHT